ncbi:hypothetical protein GCM10023150_05030 [Kangiella taiwanensis]|uniref:YHYH domain-containing protein n=1 Tax=Kangiella taiwanensis TaxID=1079179 RepID=A0ABP8HV19_9GAMM
MILKQFLLGAVVVAGLLSTQKVTASETNCYYNSDGTLVCYTCNSDNVCKRHYPNKEK